MFATVRWQCLAGWAPHGTEGRAICSLQPAWKWHNPQRPHSGMTPTLTKPLLSDPAPQFCACPCAPVKEAGCVQQGESPYSLLTPPGLYTLCAKPTLSRFPVHLVKPGLPALPRQLIFCGTRGATKPEKPCCSFFNYIHCCSKDKVGITEIIRSEVLWQHAAVMSCTVFTAGVG